MAEESDLLKLHIEPDRSIEVDHLTAALGSLSRQYQIFAQNRGFSARAADARLLVSSVSRGSIDIAFIPDLTAAGVAILPLIDTATLIEKFADHLGALIGWFQGKGEKPKEITVKDCDDAINIVKPVAEAGGTQTFNTINGDVHITVLKTSAVDARSVIEGASNEKARLLAPMDGDKRQRVSMVWHRLARDAARTDGVRSPDQGLIDEIDPKPHAVLFTDDMAYLKREMIDDEANPYQKVYFVDVDVSRVNGRVTAYRIAGYHGKDDFTP
ncbi:MAG: hypothetical protein EOS41_05840 [Mesorhizobium sp.]|uniref:hypothetical protein n=1 Tax=Mesorhizobium sp. TaxID=1871066 RepID=UPI000FE59C92|nr:hypothetical protein [Mesorhizobium sp.]RWE26651.1 MAG: hypothetical protein EOS41_05840 [Mesorhizobium sp.]